MSATQAAAIGVDRRKLAEYARRGVVTRVARGVYCIGTVPPDPRAIVAGTRTTLSHHSAAAWWGVDLPAPPQVIHITAPRNRGRRRDSIRGVRLHRADLGASEVVMARGIAATTPLRTSLDIARCESTENAVAVLDAFLRSRLVSVSELHAAADRSAGPGRTRLRQAVALADPAAGSILESLARVLLWRHGIPPRLSRAGWKLGVVTWLDVVANPGYVVALVSDLLDIQHTSGTDVAERRRLNAS